MKVLKFTSILLVSSIMIMGCSGDPETTEAKKAKLQDYKDQLANLKTKIQDLEEEIQKEDTLKKADQRKLVNLNPVRKTNFKHFIEVRGEATSNKNVKVSPEMSGVIERIHFEEGDEVEKGALLAELDNATIQRNIDQIKTNLEHARNLFERQKNLWDQDIGSEVEYLQAKNRVEDLEKRLASAKSRLANTKIRSPIQGQIDEIFFNEGEMANPASPLCRVVNLKDMQVVGNLSESYLGEIKIGDSVELHFPNMGIKKTSKVSHVGQFIDPDSRTFKVEIKVENQDRLIKPNALATIRFSDYSNPEALVIPSHLLQESDEQPFIFTARKTDNKWKAAKTLIQTGKSYDGFTEVKSGLNANSKLIVKGYKNVADGESLRLPN